LQLFGPGEGHDIGHGGKAFSRHLGRGGQGDDATLCQGFGHACRVLEYSRATRIVRPSSQVLSYIQSTV
jgi:hypothetical protein